MPDYPSDDKPLLAVLRGERRDPPPMWLMRQAGRYLPEYRELRAAKGGFLDMAYDPEAAAEITLQPLRRFPFDGAILFSDILVVPHAMGMDLTFVAGEGPRLAPPLSEARIRDLKPAMERLEPIYETVRRVKAHCRPRRLSWALPDRPWTVATYMIAGQGSREQAEARQLAYLDPGKMEAILDIVSPHHRRLSVGPDRSRGRCRPIVRQLGGQPLPGAIRAAGDRAARRGSSSELRSAPPGYADHRLSQGRRRQASRLCRRNGVDAIGLDETVDPAWAARELPAGLPVQGNLDPLALIAGGEALRTATRRILDAFADRPHIFNLGHGIQQTTPIEHVEQLVALVKGQGGE